MQVWSKQGPVLHEPTHTWLQVQNGPRQVAARGRGVCTQLGLQHGGVSKAPRPDAGRSGWRFWLWIPRPQQKTERPCSGSADASMFLHSEGHKSSKATPSKKPGNEDLLLRPPPLRILLTPPAQKEPSSLSLKGLVSKLGSPAGLQLGSPRQAAEALKEMAVSTKSIALIAATRRSKAQDREAGSHRSPHHPPEGRRGPSPADGGWPCTSCSRGSSVERKAKTGRSPALTQSLQQGLQTAEAGATAHCPPATLVSTSLAVPRSPEDQSEDGGRWGWPQAEAENSFAAASRLVCDHRSGYNGPAKLMHKMNYHICALVSLQSDSGPHPMCTQDPTRDLPAPHRSNIQRLGHEERELLGARLHWQGVRSRCYLEPGSLGSNRIGAAEASVIFFIEIGKKCVCGGGQVRKAWRESMLTCL
ncbi:uncharacterized protein LOC111730954 isoform X1 [Pteropus vampyrus]|uniref:Uncharacterized protein LOC111730954 isoform X1 n=1 Tax=Pteropus vampyrus TaxID=132908 RepID=A0A6P6BSS3_PTEVA|nr:uncharacterized protein LOC111730954 isoform X1 [Pteropus vampyrus]